MKRGKLKYGCALGKDKKFFPAGTEVEICEINDPRVQEKWPGMQSNKDSNQIAIIFPGESGVTIHDKESVELMRL